jgi:hypothetical protein
LKAELRERYPAPSGSTVSEYLMAIESKSSFSLFKRQCASHPSEDELFFDEILEGQLKVSEASNTQAPSWFNNIAAIGWIYNLGETDSATACASFVLAVKCASASGSDGAISTIVLIDMIEFLLVEITGSDGAGIDDEIRKVLGEYVNQAKDQFEVMKEEGQVLHGNLRACSNLEQQFEGIDAMLI